MKIENFSKETSPSVILKPFFASGEKTGTITENLDFGEWMVISGKETTEIHFSMDEKWNPEETATQFRLFTSKTKKHWGAAPLLEMDFAADRVRAALRGMLMSEYSAGPKKESADITLQIAVSPEPDTLIERATAEAEAQMWAMHLVDLPPNKKTPEILGHCARESAKKYGFDCEVWNHEQIIKDGLNTLHSVGRGSFNEPVFIISRYNGRPNSKDIDLAMVGKGITFDTGGISIKGATNLHYMKSDMAGAAAMLGSIELAARLKLRINITVIVPSAENSVDGKSLLPGEVIDSYSGKTIEIINTDAEGRLVLADGLAWVNKNLKPKVLLDMATLTGSSVRALGKEAAALYSSNENLSDALYDSGMRTGEKLWKMPLWPEYFKHIESDVADIANLSQVPIAGSIIAAKFLEFFTENHPNWAHIDMPGMSFGDSPFNKWKSATGYGVQLLSDFMDKLIENPEIAASKSNEL